MRYLVFFIWHRLPKIFLIPLLPLSLIYFITILIRKYFLTYILSRYTSPINLIIVGNLNIGGSGKTPFTLWLANYLYAKEKKIGIISSGYKSNVTIPKQISSTSKANEVGDEALLLHSKTEAVVVSSDNRVNSTKFLDNKNLDYIIHDDGLQHYRLHRDIEIAVIDGARGFGNRHCLPAGPLRESVSRLNAVDFVVVNGEHSLENNINVDEVFHIKPQHFRNLSSGEIVNLGDWSGPKTVFALAAIGNPQRFADTLESLGFEVILISYDDHQVMTYSDLTFEDDYPVIITSKDAVKFSSVDLKHVWVLDVKADISANFVSSLMGDVDINEPN